MKSNMLVALILYILFVVMLLYVTYYVAVETPKMKSLDTVVIETARIVVAFLLLLAVFLGIAIFLRGETL
ncbi:MAG: hypothetical protein LRS47_00455 [Desulfurococcales archaeon]|nr:hypothetical protein [Desulfurococcales archaeon]